MANLTEANVLVNQVQEVLGDEYVDGKLNISLDTSSIDNANLQKDKIAEQEEQLRQIKEEADRSMDYITEGYQDAARNVKPKNTSFWAGLVGRRKKEVKQQQQDLGHGWAVELEPYKDVEKKIEDLLPQLDSAKQKLTNYINENK